jgi:hypothetical protein
MGERRDMRRTTTRDDVGSSLIVAVQEAVEAI